LSGQTFAFMAHNVKGQTGTEEPYPKGSHFEHIPIRLAAGVSPRPLFELCSQLLHNP